MIDRQPLLPGLYPEPAEVGGRARVVRRDRYYGKTGEVVRGGEKYAFLKFDDEDIKPCPYPYRWKELVRAD